MVERKSGNEVKRWEIQNHFRNLEWEELIKLCDEISFELNDLEKSYQVRALYNHGNYLKCYEICSSTVSKNPKYNLIFLRFKLRSAVILDLKYEISEAIIDFLTNFPSELEPKIADMKVQYSQGNFYQSIKISEEILAINKSNFPALIYKARSLTKHFQDIDLIKSSWLLVLSSSEENLEAMNQLARISITQDNFEEAESYLQKIMILDPNYEPLTTTKKMILSSKKEGSEKLLEMKKNYIDLYYNNEYYNLINYLGGLDNYYNWNLKESLFVLRSLNMLKDYKNTIEIFEKIKIDNYGPILNEALLAAEKLNLDEKKYNYMKTLSDLSRKDKISMNYYLRSLIYSNSSVAHTSSEIRELLLIHGNSNLERIIKYVLKSEKYEIIPDIGIGDDIISILDPVQGSLKYVLNENEYREIWINLNHKISRALSRVKKNLNKTPYSFHETFYNNTQYPLLTINDDLDIFQNLKESKITYKSDIPDIRYKQIKKLAYNLDSNLLNKNTCLLFSPNYEDISFINNYDNIYRVDFKFEGYNNFYATRYSISSLGENFLFEEKISADPRESIGRVFSIIKDLDSITLLKTSLSVRWISEILPHKIYIESSQNSVKIAAMILGYDEQSIIEL